MTAFRTVLNFLIYPQKFYLTEMTLFAILFQVCFPKRNFIMHLAIKFNESFKTSQGNDFELRMYAANAYGCNAVCYNHMEKLHAASNDSVTPSKKMGGL